MSNIYLSTAEIPNWFAVTMGIGTVFAGLISIIIICVITGFFCGGSKRKTDSPAKALTTVTKREDDREIIAAVCAVCAEDMGADVNSLKVISFKKL
ncbi:MAG: OadG family protein [Clostridia bacterium]|nr:OadG family protein [Clostridia bacterium]